MLAMLTRVEISGIVDRSRAVGRGGAVGGRRIFDRRRIFDIRWIVPNDGCGLVVFEGWTRWIKFSPGVAPGGFGLIERYICGFD